MMLPRSPGAMALSAAGSAESVEKAYNATAKELKAVGINWAYSPVADINSNSRNPVIGKSAFRATSSSRVPFALIDFIAGVRSFSDGESRPTPGTQVLH